MDPRLMSGFAAGIYAAILLAIGSAMLVAGPRSRTNRAFTLFSLGSFLLGGGYALILMGWSWGGPTIHQFATTSVAPLRIAIGLLIAAWMHLAIVLAARPGSKWEPAKLSRAIVLGVVLGLLNYLNYYHSPWEYVTANSIQAAGIVATSLVILIIAVEGRTTTTPGSLARRRANAYLAAFVAHDAVMLVIFGVSGVGFSMASAELAMTLEAYLLLGGYVALSLVFIPALVYSVLTGRVLDLDRRFHFTVSRTTVAAVFIAVFVGVQTVVSEFAASAWGLPAAGIAAGALFFALTPLQRLAEKVADRAVPHGRAGATLSRAEQEAFYREQVEIAYSDGAIGAKERRTLQNVRARLGLDDQAALAIEDKVADRH